MKQIQIVSVAGAIVQANKAIGGATDHGASINIKHNTAAVITTDKDGLITRRDAANEAKTQLKDRRSELRSMKRTAFAFATLTRDLLKPVLGSQHSAIWDTVGFVGSLEVPRSAGKLTALMSGIVSYLTAHPTVEQVGLDVTKDRAISIYNNLVEKVNAEAAQRSAAQTAVSQKADSLKVVVKRIGGLRKELSELIGPVDPRWLAFGFNKPGILSVAPAPTGLIAVLIGPMSVALKWAKAARAERYRIYKKVVGVDNEMGLVETREDLDFTIDDLPSGKTIELAITAVNNGGESQLSQTVSVVTP